MNNFFRRFTEFVIFALPAGAVWLVHGVTAPMILLLLISLSGFVLVRDNKVILDKSEIILLILFFLFSLYSIVTWWWHDFNVTGMKHVDKHFIFMLSIPIYYWLRCIKPNSIYLWYGIFVGAILTSAVALYDIQILNLARAHGAVHPILFGNTALTLGFMGLAARELIVSRFVFVRFLPIIVLFSGITASMLSGSRGGWIAVPLLLLIFIVSYWRSFNVRYKLIVGLAILILPVFLYIAPETGVDKRLDSAWSDVDNYLTGKNIDTSLGIRFESWKAAFYMLEEHPLFGVGLGRFQQEAQALIDNGSVREGAADFNHTHNDYIYQLSVNGVVGFVFLFLVYIYPLRLFYKNISFGDPEIKALSIAGLCFVVAFMHYSLSETLMIRSLPVSLYNFFILVLLALIYNKKLLLENS